MNKKVYNVPLPEVAIRQPNNGISQVILGLMNHLPKFGYELIGKREGTELNCFHAGEGDGKIDLAICHGLHPTYMVKAQPVSVLFRINKRVISDIAMAKQVVVPSQWVADIFRRQMKLDPHVIQWGINFSDWRFDKNIESGSYVLWNKNRNDPVCDPIWMQETAAIMPNQVFVSTFGNKTTNVNIIGRQSYNEMVPLVKRADVYLATTKETGDIGSREALASGVPVVAFNQGGVTDVVKHGINGYLAPPGNVEALVEGIKYCKKHRNILSYNAITLSKNYGWDTSAQQVADIFTSILDNNEFKYDVSVIIPCHNYSKTIKRAIESVITQKVNNFNFEIIIVDDASTDDSVEVILSVIREYPKFPIKFIVSESNIKVAQARNCGIDNSSGEFIICLDADDQLAPGALQTLYTAINGKREIGIVYGQLIFEHTKAWPGWPPDKCDIELFLDGYNQVPSCCMYRYEDWKRAGGYRTHMEPAEDADLFLRLLAYTGRKAEKVTKEPTVIYNYHSDSLSNEYRQANGDDPFIKRGTTIWKSSLFRPIALDPPVKSSLPSNLVYNYDNPLIKIIITGDGDMQKTKDSIEFQTYWNWTLDQRIDTPLIMHIKAGYYVPPDWVQTQVYILENILDDDGEIPERDPSRKGEIQMGCCGKGIEKGNILMSQLSPDEIIHVLFIRTGAGKIFVPSPTGKRFGNQDSTKAYGRRKHGDIFEIHKDDLPELTRRGYVKEHAIIATPTLQAVQDPILPPPPLKIKPKTFAEEEPIAILDIDELIPSRPIENDHSILSLKELSKHLGEKTNDLRRAIRIAKLEPVHKDRNTYLYDVEKVEEAIKKTQKS